jgi:epoxyqueuosine reductase
VSVALKGELEALAKSLGFHDLRVTTPEAIGTEAGVRLGAFIEAGLYGDMDWMARTAERRGSVSSLWPEVRSILMLGMSYAPESDPLAILDEPLRGAISCYAPGKDYHDIVKRGLILIARRLGEVSGAEVKVFVDTAPLMEKPLAAAAGLGWQGKHTNLVSRTAGSWLFLGAILTTAEIEPDQPAADHCGSCQRCLDACPTNAFPVPYQLDPRRCIAYLTIEHKGHIAREFRAAIGNRVFGCDDCLAVCPWNKFAAASRDIRFKARAGTDSPPLVELLALSDEAFRLRFAGTPVKRTGRDRVVRNALIAAGNSGDPALKPSVVALLGDASPLVRAMAVWALARFVDRDELEALQRSAEAGECDPAVVEEWRVALATRPPSDGGA